MTNYQVGDFLIRVKNAARAGLKEISTETSKLKKAVAQVLKKEGFLSDVAEKNGQLTVRLAYHKKEPVILDLKLVSKPGLRIYKSADALSSHKGATTLILSTSKGVLSLKDALKQGVGGEVLAEVL